MILQAATGAEHVVRIAPFLLVVVCVGLYHGAYVAEVIRTGIEAIPRGQMEGAQSQGFSRVQAYRYIILPQTFRIILPPLANQALNLVKNTSVLALIAGGDLMYQSDIIVADTGYLQLDLRICRHSAVPSISGSITSKSIKSGFSFFSNSNACSPL